MENKQSKKDFGVYDRCFNPVVCQAVPEKTVCLDVGCWTGNLGESLIADKNCIVDGLDLEGDVLEAARSKGYRNTYQIDLNDGGRALEEVADEGYDCVVCADVLEHLADPSLVLKGLRSKLKEGGFVLISVPNIAFIKQRLELLFGRFDYNPEGGIMDEGHLRFFTCKSLTDLLEKAGFKVTFIRGYNLVRPRFFFLKFLGRLFPTLFSVQFLAKAGKR